MLVTLPIFFYSDRKLELFIKKGKGIPLIGRGGLQSCEM
jgi:hypothetical protein